MMPFFFLCQALDTPAPRFAAARHACFAADDDTPPCHASRSYYQPLPLMPAYAADGCCRFTPLHSMPCRHWFVDAASPMLPQRAAARRKCYPRITRIFMMLAVVAPLPPPMPPDDAAADVALSPPRCHIAAACRHDCRYDSALLFDFDFAFHAAASPLFA